MAAREFCTVSEAKQYMGLVVDTDDGLIARLILAATEWIENYTSRHFLADNYTERRNGTGGQLFMLANRPVLSVSAVQIGSPNMAALSLVLNRDYFITESGLQRPCGWVRGLSNVYVAYRAGYEVLPWEINDACIQIVAWRYKEGRRIAEQTKSIGGNETISYQTIPVPNAVKKSLDQWTNTVPL